MNYLYLLLPQGSRSKTMIIFSILNSALLVMSEEDPDFILPMNPWDNYLKLR